MNNFNFISPTKIYFGKDKELEIGKILKSLGSARILIIYGMNSVIKSGLLDAVTNLLNEENIEYVLFGGVRANPTREKVLSGVKFAKEKKIDFILALGGGSVIDCSKSIGVGYYYDGDPFDFNCYKAKPTKTIPVGVILTIAAAGSELSNSCVIQDDALGMKKGFNDDLVRPVFVIEDPVLTFTTPKYQTACGITDIMMHTLERYFSNSGKFELADDLAVGLLKSVVSAGIFAINNPNDYDSRACLMLASSYSHNGLTSLGKANKFPCHYLEHILSGLYPNVAHGAGLAVIFPAWCEQYIIEDSIKMNRLTKELFHIDCKNDIEGAKIFIIEIKEYFSKLGMPSCFSELGLVNVNVDDLIEQYAKNGTRVIDHGTKPLDQTLARQIFNLCNK